MGRTTQTTTTPPTTTTTTPLTQIFTTLEENASNLIPPSLQRLTSGLPKQELDLMKRESLAVIKDLTKEIKLLEASVGIVSTDLDEFLVEEDKDDKEEEKKKKKKEEEKKREEETKKETTITTKKRKRSCSQNQLHHHHNNNPSLPSSKHKKPPALDIPGGLPTTSDTTDAMLTSEILPSDRYFTVSALLGRLRDVVGEVATPPPPNSARWRKVLEDKREVQGMLDQIVAVEGVGGKGDEEEKKKELSSKQEENTASATTTTTTSSSSGGTTAISANVNTLKEKIEAKRKSKQSMLDKQKALLALEENEMYRLKQTETSTLLSLWKRISSHRTATVFRKPVNAREAPGYNDRIVFPMDLSLIRKMITSGMIVSYADLHERIGLICHNCVKFNGRDSDYGMVTRDFESYVDDAIVGAVTSAAATAASAATAAAAAMGQQDKKLSSPSLLPSGSGIVRGNSSGGGGA